jgi:hypothetical protein
MVTLNGCSSPISNKVWVVITGQPESQSTGINIYPVPNDGRFTVAISSPVTATYTITVYNKVGQEIRSVDNIRVAGITEHVIDLRPAASGIYSVVVTDGEHRVVRKIIVSR